MLRVCPWSSTDIVSKIGVVDSAGNRDTEAYVLAKAKVAGGAAKVAGDANASGEGEVKAGETTDRHSIDSKFDIKSSLNRQWLDITSTCLWRRKRQSQRRQS